MLFSDIYKDEPAPRFVSAGTDLARTLGPQPLFGSFLTFEATAPHRECLECGSKFLLRPQI
jgi:hypothetical protein